MLPILIALLVMAASLVIGAWAYRNSAREREELGQAMFELRLAVNRAFGVATFLGWLDRQLRRFPRLYSLLSR